MGTVMTLRNRKRLLQSNVSFSLYSRMWWVGTFCPALYLWKVKVDVCEQRTSMPSVTLQEEHFPVLCLLAVQSNSQIFEHVQKNMQSLKITPESFLFCSSPHLLFHNPFIKLACHPTCCSLPLRCLDRMV